MSEQTIQSQDIKVAEVFQAFYVVPDYQREYVWETDQVEQLLTDIYGEMAGNQAEAAPEYFIGSIVVCPGTDGVLDLIDGQQRMTTLFLMLCAIRDRLGELGQPPSGALEPQIAAVSVDASGVDRFRYRLELQYEDSGDVLERIAKEKAEEAETTTRSTTNIMNAYETVLGFLRQEFAEDASKLKAFYGYLTNKVKLIRIETQDVAKALKIFETINDRGVGLDAMDLLKNLLFMKANREQFDKLKNVWKELQDTIYEAGEKPLRFLRYFIFSRYDVDQLREDEIYTWFAKHEPECGYGSEPVAFANELLSAARAYTRFLGGRDEKGDKSPVLENLQLLGGKAARQHLILLLAGRHLSAPLFDRLAREVENLFFVYVITRENTRDFERNFARWSKDLRKVKGEAEFDAFIEKRFVPSKADLAERFADAFRRLYGFSVQQYRLRYILAKLTQYIEIEASNENEITRWLSSYVKGGFEIEHIFPQSPSKEAVEEFGPAEDLEISERIGNLVLVEKPINASLGNGPFSEKRKVYPQSALLLARAVSERPKVGSNTKINKAVADLEPFEHWNEGAVGRRQEMMRRLACNVWDVPDKSGSPG